MNTKETQEKLIPVSSLRSILENELNRYENTETYTDCEEYRRQGAVSVLENLLDNLTQEELPL